MKQSIIIILILVLSNSYANAQYKCINIEYKTIETSSEGEQMIYYSVLKDDGRASTYLQKDTSAYKGDMLQTQIDKKKNSGLYINKLTDQLYMYSPIINKDFYILEDSLTSQFQWNIQNTATKIIMGYTCKKASCFFRGRQYEVFYTEQLPFFSGPWKICNLPGVVLEAKTIDNRLKISAYSVRLEDSDSFIVNPYLDKNINFGSFIQYKVILRKVLNNLQKKVQAEEKEEEGGWISIDDTAVEIIK
ncbi:MAG: GLPGLI family protein [Chitinophagaceae bacterium]